MPPATPPSCQAIIDPIAEAIRTKIGELNEETDCINFLADKVCTDLSNQVSKTLSDNQNLMQDIADTNQGLLDDLIQIIGGDGETPIAFDIRLQQAFDKDPSAPSVEAPFSTPSANVPAGCAGSVDYGQLAFLKSMADRALSYEKYLRQRLSAACGQSATELGAIEDELDKKLAYAKKFKADCLDEFYGAFKEEGETFEMYSEDQQNAFEAA